jgi:hypothetical protein
MSMKNEKYKSKSAEKRHEKMEGAKEMMMEYGKIKKKPGVKKPKLKKGK